MVESRINRDFIRPSQQFKSLANYLSKNVASAILEIKSEL